MLFGALVRGPLLYVPNVGAQPEPPVRFNVNVQGLVGVLNRVKGVETDRSLNLNAQVAKETQPAVADETKTLDRVFLNDLVAMDADRRGKRVPVREPRRELRAARDARRRTASSTSSMLRTRPVRFQTGNLPSGVVMSRDGKRAYTNNELNTSITRDRPGEQPGAGARHRIEHAARARYGRASSPRSASSRSSLRSACRT